MRIQTDVANFAAGTAMGALIAWGLTYDTLTAATPAAAFSSWAQVTVAVAVGYASVQVPRRIALAEQRRRREIFVSLLLVPLASSVDLLRLLSVKGCATSRAEYEACRRALTYQAAALENYPVQDVPSAKLLEYRAEAQAYCDSVLQTASRTFDWLRSTALTPVQAQNLASLQSYGRLLLNRTARER